MTDGWWRDEQIRQAELERQRRQAEITAEANRSLWMYWNDPVHGVLARLKREAEHRRLLAAEDERERATARRDLETPVEWAAGGDPPDIDPDRARRAQRDLVEAVGEEPRPPRAPGRLPGCVAGAGRGV